MVKWLLPRDKKETRACDSCGKYKQYSQFYDWHHHPGLSFLGEGRIGVVCMPCAKREAGSKQWEKINTFKGSDFFHKITAWDPNTNGVR